MFCPRCGTMAQSAAASCTRCGSTLARPRVEAPEPPAVRAPTNRGEAAQRAAGIEARALPKAPPRPRPVTPTPSSPPGPVPASQGWPPPGPYPYPVPPVAGAAPWSGSSGPDPTPAGPGRDSGQQTPAGAPFQIPAPNAWPPVGADPGRRGPRPATVTGPTVTGPADPAWPPPPAAWTEAAPGRWLPPPAAAPHPGVARADGPGADVTRPEPGPVLAAPRSDTAHDPALPHWPPPTAAPAPAALAGPGVPGGAAPVPAAPGVPGGAVPVPSGPGVPGGPAVESTIPPAAHRPRWPEPGSAVPTPPTRPVVPAAGPERTEPGRAGSGPSPLPSPDRTMPVPTPSPTAQYPQYPGVPGGWPPPVHSSAPPPPAPVGPWAPPRPSRGWARPSGSWWDRLSAGWRRLRRG